MPVMPIKPDLPVLNPALFNFFLNKSAFCKSSFPSPGFSRRYFMAAIAAPVLPGGSAVE